MRSWWQEKISWREGVLWCKQPVNMAALCGLSLGGRLSPPCTRHLQPAIVDTSVWGVNGIVFCPAACRAFHGMSDRRLLDLLLNRLHPFIFFIFVPLFLLHLSVSFVSSSACMGGVPTGHFAVRKQIHCFDPGYGVCVGPKTTVFHLQEKANLHPCFSSRRF